MSFQRCAGCGIEAATHPIVGIALPTEEFAPYQLDVQPSSRGFVAHGVCARCHADPSARRRALKMAFFPVEMLVSALAEAGSNSVRAT